MVTVLEPKESFIHFIDLQEFIDGFEIYMRERQAASCQIFLNVRIFSAI